MERKASSKKDLAKTASKDKELQKTPSKGVPAAEPAPAALDKAPSKKDLARSKSKSKESLAPAAPEAPVPPMIKAPSLKAKSPSKELPPAKKKRDAAFGLDGSYWTTGRKTNRPPSVVLTTKKTKTYKRAAPVAGGLRKNKPSYAKMVDSALKHLAATHPRKGHSVIEVRKWIESRYPVPDNAVRPIRLALTSAVNSKRVVRSGMRYRLAAKALKATKKAKRTKSTKAAKVAKKTKAAGGAVKKTAVKGALKKATKASAAVPALVKRTSSAQIAAAAYGAGRPAPVNVGAAYAAFKKNFIWQFKDNSGKWANYDPAASDVVEGCYEEYQANPHMMDVRAVHSGEWQYQVDFLQMKQTNIQHEAHRVRDIRRVENPAKVAK